MFFKFQVSVAAHKVAQGQGVFRSTCLGSQIYIRGPFHPTVTEKCAETGSHSTDSTIRSQLSRSTDSVFVCVGVSVYYMCSSTVVCGDCECDCVCIY